MERTLVLKFDARMLVLVGALLVAVGIALPWANLPSFLAGDLARQGMNSGGLLTLGLAVLAAISLLLPWHPFRRVSLPAAVLAALIDLVALMALVQVIQLAGILQMSLGDHLGSVGSGLYLTFAGVFLMVVGGLDRVRSPDYFAVAADQAARWLEHAGRVALIGVLLAACVCAWGIGWLVRPFALVAPGQVKVSPTFIPAPASDLATPLVNVQPAPLGNVPTAPVPSPTFTRLATSAPATPTPTPPRGTPTLRPGTPTLLPTPTPIHTATSTSTHTATPTVAPTATTFTSPLATSTKTATPTPTATTTE